MQKTQERLDHSNISTTMDAYDHVLEESGQRVATHFEQLFSNK